MRQQIFHHGFCQLFALRCEEIIVLVNTENAVLGSLVPIAVFSEENYTGYEGYNVPTVQSFGYDIVFRTCNFVMTKADVAPEDVAAIHQAILDYSETEEFKDLAKNANYIPYLEDGETVKQIILDASDLCKEAYDKYYAQ